MLAPPARTISVSALLLLAAVCLALPNSKGLPVPASSVPSRSLLAEISKADVGSAATVRTAQGSGPGMVLGASQEILASLHVVLTDKKQIDPHIAVDISTPPRKPVMNLSASVVAQDPGDDLVLLKLSGPIPTPAALVSAPLIPAPGSTVIPSPAVARSPEPERAAKLPQHIGSRGTPVPTAQSEVAIPVMPEQPSEAAFPVTRHAYTRHTRVHSRRPRRHSSASSIHRHSKVAPRVVYDGP